MTDGARVTEEELASRLGDAMGRAGVVGAAVAVSFDGRRSVAGAGLLDAGSSAPVVPGTSFRMGSIAKVATATALTRLLGDAGRSVDDPVVDLLSGVLPVVSSPWTAAATWRHVLSHRSGIDGTWWEGVGDAPGALERYCARVPELGALFPPGAAWGYSNSAFVVAGRAVEVLAGRPFEVAAAEAALLPLGLASTELWTDGPPAGAASGHRGIGPGAAERVDGPGGLRGLAPAGATAFTTAHDLLDLADRALADGGDAQAAEAEPMPPGGAAAATHQALGWRVYRWGAHTVFGHDGGAAGQASFLRWVPATRTGIALLANTAPAAMALWAELSEWVFAEAGIVPPGWSSAEPGATAEAADVGEYRSRDATFSASEGAGEPGQLELRVVGLGGSLTTSVQLRALGGSVYRASAPITDPTRIVSFEQPAGSPRLLHCGPFTAARA